MEDKRKETEKIDTSLRPAVITWAFAGWVGVPVCVYFDLLGGWQWAPHNRIYDQMMVSIYVSIGLCSVLAVRHPSRHLSFLWFVVLSSFLHGLVMLYHAVASPEHRNHLKGDVWILAGATQLAVPLVRAMWSREHCI
jgi:hypothetical protein